MLNVVKKILYKNMKDIIFVFEDELLIEKLKYLNNEGNVILVDDFLDISETTNKILEIVS